MAHSDRVATTRPMFEQLVHNRTKKAIVILHTGWENSMKLYVGQETAEPATEVQHFRCHGGEGSILLDFSAIGCKRNEYSVLCSFLVVFRFAIAHPPLLQGK